MLFLPSLVLATWTCSCQAACQRGHVAWQLHPCWKRDGCRLPCYCTLCWAGNVSHGAASSGCAQPPASLQGGTPQREGKRETTSSRVISHSEEGAKQVGTSRGRVLVADGFCAGCSLILTWICMTMRSISPSETRLEEKGDNFITAACKFLSLWVLLLLNVGDQILSWWKSAWSPIGFYGTTATSRSW